MTTSINVKMTQPLTQQQIADANYISHNSESGWVFFGGGVIFILGIFCFAFLKGWRKDGD